jgi:hypothetical protein
VKPEYLVRLLFLAIAGVFITAVVFGEPVEWTADQSVELAQMLDA